MFKAFFSLQAIALFMLWGKQAAYTQSLMPATVVTLRGDSLKGFTSFVPSLTDPHTIVLTDVMRQNPKTYSAKSIQSVIILDEDDSIKLVSINISLYLKNATEDFYTNQMPDSLPVLCRDTLLAHVLLEGKLKLLQIGGVWGFENNPYCIQKGDSIIHVYTYKRPKVTNFIVSNNDFTDYYPYRMRLQLLLTDCPYSISLLPTLAPTRGALRSLVQTYNTSCGDGITFKDASLAFKPVLEMDVVAAGGGLIYRREEDKFLLPEAPMTKTSTFSLGARIRLASNRKAHSHLIIEGLYGKYYANILYDFSSDKYKYINNITAVYNQLMIAAFMKLNFSAGSRFGKYAFIGPTYHREVFSRFSSEITQNAFSYTKDYLQEGTFTEGIGIVGGAGLENKRIGIELRLVRQSVVEEFPSLGRTTLQAAYIYRLW